MFKRHRRIFLMMAWVGPLIGLLLSAFITKVMPKKYESEAIIEAKPAAWPGGMYPQIQVTEFEKIKGYDALGQVADHLYLEKKWGMARETVIQVLKGIVIARNIRGTDLISIKVSHANKVDARDIIAEVIRGYKKYRRDILQRSADHKLAEIHKSIRDQDVKVEDLRIALATVSARVRRNIKVDGTETLLHLPENQDEANARREFETAQAELQEMKLKQVGEAMVHSSAQLIEVHDEPQIAESPVSPNVALVLFVGATSGLLVSPLLSLAVIVLINLLNPSNDNEIPTNPP